MMPSRCDARAGSACGSGAVAVLERRDDAAAVGVVLRVRRRDEEDVERQPDLVAADLDVALLHDVEQTDLDALGKVGQLVDGEDAAVGARDQAVVNRQLVGEVAALGDPDRVDLADEVGDRDVRRRQLLAETAVAADPFIRASSPRSATMSWPIRKGVEGVVVGLRSQDRDPTRRAADERADEASSPDHARPGRSRRGPQAAHARAAAGPCPRSPTRGEERVPAVIRATALGRNSSLTGTDSQPASAELADRRRAGRSFTHEWSP